MGVLFPESSELLGNLFLAGGCWYAFAESSANGLLDPDDIGEVVPSDRLLEGQFVPWIIMSRTRHNCS